MQLKNEKKYLLNKTFIHGHGQNEIFQSDIFSNLRISSYSQKNGCEVREEQMRSKDRSI